MKGAPEDFSWMRRRVADPVCPPAVRARLRVGVLGAVTRPRVWPWAVGALVSSVALAGGLYVAGLGKHTDPQVAHKTPEAAAPLLFADPTSAPGRAVDRSAPPLHSGDEGEVAAPVSAFVDSIGVNVRLRRYPALFAVLKERLHELGIRHVADVSTSRLDLLADLGVAAQLWIWPGQDISALTKGDPPWLHGLAFSDFAAPDGDVSRWALTLRAFMTEVQGILRPKEGPHSRVSIIGATLSSDEKRRALGDVSDLVDFGGSGSPSWRLPPGGAGLEILMARQQINFSDKPQIVGQALYSTAGEDSVGENVQARYLLRTFFENFRRGVVRTFGSHLMDLVPHPKTFEEGLGLVRFDGTPKPAFHAIRALVAGLSDSSAGVPQHGRVRLGLTSGPRPVEHALLSRPDGRILLALWLSVPSEEGQMVRQSVRVTWPSMPQALRILRPAEGPDFVPLTAAIAQDIDVGDDVVIVEMTRPDSF